MINDFGVFPQGRELEVQYRRRPGRENISISKTCGLAMEMVLSSVFTEKSATNPCFFNFSKILKEYFESGAEIFLRPALEPFFILVSKSQDKELIIFFYQLALLTPGRAPVLANFLKHKRQRPNRRI